VSDSAEFREARFVRADLTGAEFREATLSSARFVGVVMVDAEISGLVQNLNVNGVDVVPLVEAELDRRHPERLLLRSADPDDLRQAWANLEVSWTATVERIAALPPPVRHERVANEWSAVETLRHMIFVTDSWFGRTIGNDPKPYAPFALPPGFVEDAETMGIDVDATPSFTEVLAARTERIAAVRSYLEAVTPDELARQCAPNPAPGFPPVPEQHTVLDCIHVLLDEEWAHHRFAIRDLAAIEGTR
jgi:hypothetical protein